MIPSTCCCCCCCYCYQFRTTFSDWWSSITQLSIGFDSCQMLMGKNRQFSLKKSCLFLFLKLQSGEVRWYAICQLLALAKVSFLPVYNIGMNAIWSFFGHQTDLASFLPQQGSPFCKLVCASPNVQVVDCTQKMAQDSHHLMMYHHPSNVACCNPNLYVKEQNVQVVKNHVCYTWIIIHVEDQVYQTTEMHHHTTAYVLLQQQQVNYTCCILLWNDSNSWCNHQVSRFEA